VLHAHDEIRVRDRRQCLQRFVQVLRTDFAGSAGTVNRFSQAQRFRFGHIEYFSPSVVSFPESRKTFDRPAAERLRNPHDEVLYNFTETFSANY
jgi:hypothetical protein